MMRRCASVTGGKSHLHLRCASATFDQDSKKSFVCCLKLKGRNDFQLDDAPRKNKKLNTEHVKVISNAV